MDTKSDLDIMDENQKKITGFLEKLGLIPEEARIYLALLEHGLLTTLQISKIISTPRTTVYRLLENLKKQGLVEELVDEHRTRAKAVNLEKIESIIKKKEDDVRRLKNIYPEISSLLSGKTAMAQPATKVLFYRGQEGMKQILWNTLKTKGVFYGYSYCTPVETTGVEFALEWAIEFNRRGLFGRDLYSDQYIESAKKNPYPSPITWEAWESRYIPPDILTIDHQIDIYNDVVAYYSWHGNEIFGVEIYNEKVARLQKQIFDVLWKTGKTRKQSCHKTLLEQ